MSEQLKLNGSGLTRLFKATHCSYKGFCAAFKHESAFRQELSACALLFPLSFWLAASSRHWVALVSCLLFLLFAEVVNSALEALADQITLEHQELIGRAKDLGSLAVLLSLLILLIVWAEAIFTRFTS